jgi:hypothetical protein
MKDFIDSAITITKNPNHKIGKNIMHKYNTMYPAKYLTVLQLITSLKEKKIEDNCKVRSDNIQGSFLCVKFTDSIDDDDNDYDNGIDKTNQAVDINVEYQKQIDDFKYKLFIAEHKEEYKKKLYIKILRDKCNSIREEFINELNNKKDDLDDFFDDVNLFN